MNRVAVVLTTLLMCFGVCCSVWAQGGTAQITGTAKDQTGGALPGVTVTVNDAVVTAMLVVLVALILAESGMEWWRVLSGRKHAVTHESPYVQAEAVGVSG